MTDPYRKSIVSLKNRTPVRFNDSAFHRTLPTDGGVYLITHIKAQEKALLYIGKAKNLRQRLYQNLLNGQSRSHTLSRKLEKANHLNNKSAVKQFLMKECAVQWVVETQPKERSFLEHFAIARFRTPLND